MAATIKVPYLPLSCSALCNQSTEIVDVVANLKKLKPQSVVDEDEKFHGDSPRLLCIIYTVEKNHYAVTAVVNTWGGSCAGFLAFSTVEDPSIPTLFVPHEGEESYNNIWHKVASIWMYVSAHYSEDFDYFLIGGDDIYVRVGLLKSYLRSEDIKAANKDGVGLYMGRRFRINETDLLFNTGGAGYVLNKVSLRALSTSLEAGQCSDMPTSAEDVNVANCLRMSGIVPWNTQDAGGADRFHHFPPHYAWRFPREEFHAETHWWKENIVDFHGPGDGGVSVEALTFHWVRTPYMDLLDMLFHCISEEQKENITEDVSLFEVSDAEITLG